MKKKKGEAKNKATMNIDPPPTTNNYERRTRHISRRKFYVTNNLNGNLKERIMGEERKQNYNVVPQSLRGTIFKKGGKNREKVKNVHVATVYFTT